MDSTFELDAGNTAWMLAAASLVLLMTPALAFFYGGMTRSKSVLNMMMMSFGALAVVGPIWMLWGYSEVFGDNVGIPESGNGVPDVVVGNKKGAFVSLGFR